ncbi:hypothetical protein LCGC14_0636050 [marine sediment metagenome]|uniref:Uncharacterized protein n=1 Tax=marine sediment metagenome TaxID=412755 RepID=A0A0F9RJT5_9ZZZZ
MNRKNVIIINGIKTELIAADLDRDGSTGGTEKVQQSFDQGNVPIKESSELGDALTKFNEDNVNKERLSSIDFMSRIDPFEMPPMVGFSSLIGLKVIPVESGIIIRNKMRKSVSLKGLGRGEFVDVVTGKKEQDIRMGAAQMGKNFVGMNK